MESELTYEVEVHRKLCIQKDIIETSQWIDVLAQFNTEMSHLLIIEKQLIKSNIIETNILGIRRKNTLVVAALCKYEKELTAQLEYSKAEYNMQSANEHEKKRAIFMNMNNDFNVLKNAIYTQLSKYQRR